MKARVKATGEIVEVYDWCEVTEMDSYKNFTVDQLEFIVDNTNYNTDYWTRLEHQYAGMAMQGLIASNLDLLSHEIIEDAISYAHALVEKMKNKEE